MSDERSPTKEQLEQRVLSAQAGDTGAFEALYDHFYDRIYRYVSFKAGDPTAAEDITEEWTIRGMETSSTVAPISPSIEIPLITASRTSGSTASVWTRSVMTPTFNPLMSPVNAAT